MREVAVNEVIVIDVDCNAALNPKKNWYHFTKQGISGEKQAGRNVLTSWTFMTLFILTEPCIITLENTAGAVLMTHREAGYVGFFSSCIWTVSSRYRCDWYHTRDCSDHSLVCITFKTNIVTRNRPFWKFNNLLLRGAVFVNLVKQVILNVKKPYALTVYDRENIHLVEDELLFLTIDDKWAFFFFFCNVTCKNQR